MNYIFETRMEVRDYECDIEGIVNNANYLHYAEHTRHLFLRSLGVSFAKLHEQGVDAVVARMNLQFKTPLRCDDEFISRLATTTRLSNSSSKASDSTSLLFDKLTGEHTKFSLEEFSEVLWCIETNRH